MAEYDVAVQVAPAFADQLSEGDLKQLAARVLDAEAVDPGAALSIAVTDDETVRDLNRRFRALDEPTDVLSFGLGDDADFPTPPGSDRQLGEVVVSLETAWRQASEAGRSLQDELHHLVAHGVLHLLGYDHEQPDEEKEMRQREEAVLHGWHH